jgi:hypothetical protein
MLATVCTPHLLPQRPHLRQLAGQLAPLERLEQDAGQAADAVACLGVQLSTPNLVDGLADQNGNVLDGPQRCVGRLDRQDGGRLAAVPAALLASLGPGFGALGVMREAERLAGQRPDAARLAVFGPPLTLPLAFHSHPSPRLTLLVRGLAFWTPFVGIITV